MNESSDFQVIFTQFMGCETNSLAKLDVVMVAIKLSLKDGVPKVLFEGDSKFHS